MKDKLVEIWEGQKLSTSEKVVKHPLTEIKGVNCYLGTIIINDAKLLSIELDDDITIHQNHLRKFSGVEIQVLKVENNKKELVIILLEKEITDIFVLFIDDVLQSLNGVKNSEDMLLKLYNRINYWKKLFGKYSKDLLTQEQQRGLYGELYFMMKLLRTSYNPITIINAWQAPEGTNQDYYFNGLVFEVKTSVSNTPSITISNEMQLNTDGLKNLYIVFFELNEQPNEKNTLTSLIKEVRGIISSNIELVNIYNSRLEGLGVSKSEEDEYNEISYSVRNETIYEVTEGFPKITSNSVYPGIFKISYKISPLNCVEYEKPFDNIMAELNNNI